MLNGKQTGRITVIPRVRSQTLFTRASESGTSETRIRRTAKVLSRGRITVQFSIGDTVHIVITAHAFAFSFFINCVNSYSFINLLETVDQIMSLNYLK